MDVFMFVRQRPCLDEIDGYLSGRRLLGTPVTTDEMAALKAWRDSLMTGKGLPAVQEMAGRTWKYKRGRPPERAREQPVVSKKIRGPT